jgi:hypothetical protein
MVIFRISGKNVGEYSLAVERVEQLWSNHLWFNTNIAPILTVFYMKMMGVGKLNKLSFDLINFGDAVRTFPVKVDVFKKRVV